jgi:hypothetical protein
MSSAKTQSAPQIAPTTPTIVLPRSALRGCSRWPPRRACLRHDSMGTGPLLVMPAVLSLPVWQFTTMAYESLIGHLVLGLMLAAVTMPVARRDTCQ